MGDSPNRRGFPGRYRHTWLLCGLVMSLCTPCHANEDSNNPGTSNRGTERSTTGDAKKEKLKKLEGHVEDIGKIRLERPNESVINQSVEILQGGSYGGTLDGTADDTALQTGTAQDSLRTMVGSGGFKLGTYKKREPQSDPGALKDWQADMDSKKFKMQDVTYTIPKYCLPGPAPCDGCLSGKYTIPGRMYQLDDWTIRQRSVQAQIRFPETGGQLLPVPVYSVPDYSLPKPVTGFSDPPLISNFTQDQEKYVEWDGWYKNVADKLWKTWRARGSLPGAAELRIKVDRKKHIEAEVLSVTNLAPAFKESLVKAVQAINGSETLTFPTQSKRQSVAFQSHFSAGVDIKSGAVSKRANETERVRVLPRH